MHGTIDMFEAALEASPQDAEIASALGVLYNLSRDWDGAVRSFRHALEVLCPTPALLFCLLHSSSLEGRRRAKGMPNILLCATDPAK